MTKDKKFSVAEDGSFKEDPKGDISLDAPAEEVKLQTTEEIGQSAPKKEMLKELPPGHTYEDRIKAQAEAMGIEIKEGQTMEYLIHRISMGGSS